MQLILGTPPAETSYGVFPWEEDEMQRERYSESSCVWKRGEGKSLSGLCVFSVKVLSSPSGWFVRGRVNALLPPSSRPETLASSLVWSAPG